MTIYLETQESPMATVLPGTLEFWYMARASAYGISLRSERPDAAAQALYAARRAACDDSLADISVLRPPGDPQILWLVRRHDTK